jgi:hypothetical protein
MACVPDITDTERCRADDAQGALRAWHRVQPPEADVRLHPSDREVTICPLLFWQSEDGCNFVIVRSGERKDRCQFYYKPYQQMSTGVEEYDGPAKCAVALLQAQADCVGERRGDLPSRED